MCGNCNHWTCMKCKFSPKKSLAIAMDYSKRFCNGCGMKTQGGAHIGSQTIYVYGQYVGDQWVQRHYVPRQWTGGDPISIPAKVKKNEGEWNCWMCSEYNHGNFGNWCKGCGNIGREWHAPPKVVLAKDWYCEKCMHWNQDNTERRCKKCDHDRH